ncbi:hypothetical protein ACIRBX_21400 [Kitasatospora sp. NPDC096147]|uniref:hypothetical protein n=1 Tax=Kitasatospora sp. NPDC096147 TaxID=3364093 RepID=UPI0037F8378A
MEIQPTEFGIRVNLPDPRSLPATLRARALAEDGDGLLLAAPHPGGPFERAVRTVLAGPAAELGLDLTALEVWDGEPFARLDDADGRPLLYAELGRDPAAPEQLTGTPPAPGQEEAVRELIDYLSLWLLVTVEAPTPDDPSARALAGRLGAALAATLAPDAAVTPGQSPYGPTALVRPTWLDTADVRGSLLAACAALPGDWSPPELLETPDGDCATATRGTVHLSAATGPVFADLARRHRLP